MVWQDFKEKVFRFVVLEHVRQEGVHWDLMLQLPDRKLLATWQIRMNPAQWRERLAPIPALQLPDHRLIYLDYQGKISGGRGVVTRVDDGFFELRLLEDGRMELVLRGQKLHGLFILCRVSGKAGDAGEADDPRHWEISCHQPLP
jgi:hypothetical protein